ncbi:DUF1254 domain-containing protein [Methylocystis heyeri]|uniref:DUF1214 domain-containing protein n=1 Tax=Methylocystis heyeri TaxID=391905 RepID=A0A6B8KF83_9HYPH|nr:DUF1254 domain-containing protein [Methylocystis heyeri]QGM45178.1 DUF1214 domain-containing protein [Methylocystis heyeri]
MKHGRSLIVAATLAAASWSVAQGAESPKYSAKVPPSVETPDTFKTRVGTLKFKDGAPDAKTAELAYDQLDYSRGIEAFLQGIPATSIYAACRGLDEAGVKENKVFGVTEELMDARSLFLTPNTTTVYVFTCVNLNDGPIVVEIPPGVLGPVDDAYFRWVTDVGLTGPDQGRGGRYLFVPPEYKGELPPFGFFVAKPKTNRSIIFFRAFVRDGDIAAAVKGVKENARIYPLAAAQNPPETPFVDTSGKQFNTISANNFDFYKELDAVVQNEPADFVSPETVGLFAAIGIKKGQSFEPNARLKNILTEAVAVGNAAARSLLWAPRDKRVAVYPDRQWINPFVGGSYLFLDGAERMLDVEASFFYYATGITPAMTEARPGTGSAYAGAFRDAKGQYLDGSKTYKITLPAPVPAKAFWALTVYSNQTRSLLETDQKTAGLDSLAKDLETGSDGSVTVWFGPKPPKGHERNWIQTVPGKGWNVLLRLYGPLEPWFDKSWKPGDVERVD